MAAAPDSESHQTTQQLFESVKLGWWRLERLGLKALTAAAPAQGGTAGGAAARTLNCFYNDPTRTVSLLEPGQVGLIDRGRSEVPLKPVNCC